MSLSVRARLVVARYGLHIAVLFFVLSAVALGAAWSLWSNPATEVRTEETNVEEYAVAAHTEAIVTGSNVTLYEPGQRLVSMPVYYFDETPGLTVVGNVTVPEGEPVTVEQRVSVVIESVRDDATFFEQVRVVDSESDRTTSGRVSVRSTIDMIEIGRMVRETRGGMRGVGNLRTRIVLTVDYESEHYSDELTATAPLVVGEEAYWLDGELAADATHSQTRTEEVVLPHDWTTVGLYGVLGLLLMLVGVGFGWRSLQGFDVERLRTDLARSEFSEWISAGEIPTRADKEYVSVVSLEDLVDIGIDSNKRVIYDGTIEAYAVVDADVVYYYTPGDDDIKEWLDV